MKYFDRLFKGELGTVSFDDTWDEDTCTTKINGVEYDTGEEVDGVDEFVERHFSEISNLVLLKQDGYRGDGCYFGNWIIDGVMYELDIMSEYRVCKLNPK